MLLRALFSNLKSVLSHKVGVGVWKNVTKCHKGEGEGPKTCEKSVTYYSNGPYHIHKFILVIFAIALLFILQCEKSVTYYSNGPYHIYTFILVLFAIALLFMLLFVPSFFHFLILKCSFELEFVSFSNFQNSRQDWESTI